MLQWKCNKIAVTLRLIWWFEHRWSSLCDQTADFYALESFKNSFHFLCIFQETLCFEYFRYFCVKTRNLILQIFQIFKICNYIWTFLNSTCYVWYASADDYLEKSIEQIERNIQEASNWHDRVIQLCNWHESNMYLNRSIVYSLDCNRQSVTW